MRYQLRDFVAGGAPIDGFGVGTRMNTSADHPYLDCAYKLQEYAGQPRRKHSEGKATWPGRKQVYRSFDADGRFVGDLLTTDDDAEPGEPLLQPAMRRGHRIAPPQRLARTREYAAEQMAKLPSALRSLDPATPYRVEVSAKLRGVAQATDLRQQQVTHRSVF